MRQKKDPIAYTLTDLPFGITLDVKSSANAWWMDKVKVLSLFNAFKISATIPEACAFVNITEKQYKYFLSKHPIVTEIRKGYKLTLVMVAKTQIAKAIYDGDIRLAWKFLAKTQPYEWGKKIGKEKPLSKPKTYPLDSVNKTTVKKLQQAAKEYSDTYKIQLEKEIDAMPDDLFS